MDPNITQAEITRHIRCVEIVTTAVSMMISQGASEQQVRELLQWASTQGLAREYCCGHHSKCCRPRGRAAAKA